MKKICLILVVLFITTLSSCGLIARLNEEPKNGVEFNMQYSLKEDDTYEVMVTGYTIYGNGAGDVWNIEIPSSYLDKPVTSFGGSWPFPHSISITIPNSVTSIAKDAFRQTSGLTSITIPDSVTSIGGGAFSHCENLNSVTIGNGVTSIGEYAFSDCAKLTSITIPDNVSTIGGRAFQSCHNLNSVTIGSGVTSIGEFAFNSCGKLVEVYNRSSLDITAGSYEFGWVGYYAKAIYTSEYVSKLSTDEDGFVLYKDGKASSLIGYVGSETALTLPLGITEINQFAFEDSDLTSIIIPESVNSIGKCAFHNSQDLTSLTIPSSVTSIGEKAFSGCSGLTSLVIPSGVTSIGEQAFSFCSGLTSITISEGVRIIDRYAFWTCTSFTSLTIPDSVTSIGDYAFCDCSGLVSIIIPDSVTSIGLGAFRGCTGISVIKYQGDIAKWCGIQGLHYVMAYGIPNRTLIIGGKVVAGALEIPNGVTSIEEYAFYSCSRLTSLTLPVSVKNIGISAFEDTGDLSLIYFQGTKAQWNVNTKNRDWKYAGISTVHCTDGEISLSESESEDNEEGVNNGAEGVLPIIDDPSTANTTNSQYVFSGPPTAVGLG